MENRTKNHIRLTAIQKLIGERMLASKRSKPCFYIHCQADVTELMKLRPKLRKSLGVKITTNAFYIRALASAALKYPLVLGVVDGDSIKIADEVNVGFAVIAPQGLVVPVIKNADRKTLIEIAAVEKLLTDKARSNKLTLQNLEGETIAMSNLGAYDIDSFIGIVPPPVSTIVSVGNIVEEVVVRNGKMQKRKTVSLTVAADAVVVNEIYASNFLRFIVELLQEPQQLVGN